jgi:hypothetical protein
VIAHVVLFTPKTTLSATERASFVDQLEAAFTSIPGIARIRVGRRIRSDRPYETLGPQHEFVAILEFASHDALRGYLEHPAHAALAEAFYLSLDHALVGDFAIASDVRALKV